MTNRIRLAATALLAALLPVLAAPGCGDDEAATHDGGTDADTDSDTDTDTDADADTDTDADADTDTDSDADTDADTDTDTDTDTDCDDVPEGCCTDACPCPEDEDQCVHPADGIDLNGVCKPIVDDACWSQDDCEPTDVCVGAFVCPCGVDCEAEDETGTCIPSTAGCCDAATGPDTCPEGYHCLELGDDDTCHAITTQPACFVDEDCGEGGICNGAVICNCMEYCLSEAGECEYYDE
jgi:hypothetical protein